MGNEPPIIVGGGTSMPPAPPRKSGNLNLILIIVLGLGTVGFGIASILAFGQASRATKTLESAKAASASAAKAEQKKADDEANVIANQSPYKSYTAPNEYGGFTITYPKDWSTTVDIAPAGATQLSFTAQPGNIRTISNTTDPLALQVTLVRQPLATYLSKLSPKRVTQTPITVAGISSMQLTGQLPDGRSSRIVAVPVRDKILLFANEDKAYASIFDTIISQAKVNP